MDPETMKVGLLMEAAQTQQHTAQASQQAVEAAISRLEAATRGLEPAMRDAVTKACFKEFEAVFKQMYAQMHQEVNLTGQTLKRLRSGFTWRLGTLAGLISAASTAVVLIAFLVGVYLVGLFDRSSASTAASRLRGEPAAIAEIERRGLFVDVALCGEPRRVCVRVEPKAGAYGPRRDQMVVGGS